jgi:Uma2 family endonuclease
LGIFVRQHRLGVLFAAETGFKLFRDPDTVRAPDVAFVAQARIPADGVPKTGYWEIAPDLVAEVVSPNDSWAEVQDKVSDYLAAGVRLVWVVEPSTQTVTAYRSFKQAQIVTVAETLDGEDVVPGFSLPLAQLFA